jgi:hypothetical protein
MEQRVIPAEFDIVACIMLGFRSALTQPTALLSGVSGQRRPQPPSAHRTVRTGPYTAPHARLIH